MKSNLFIYTGLMIIGISCTDLTEEVYESIPTSQYPENDAQVASLSVDAYARLKPLADDEGWWFWAQEVSSDEIVFPTRDADWDDGGKWRVMHANTWTNDVEGVNRMWDVLWQGVTRSNQIIDMLRKLPKSDAIINKMKEVEVMRSFYYYLLIDNYGDIPYLTSSEDVPEQPFKITRAAVFDSITTTLEQNLNALKPIDNKYMATRYMAFALLSKLYLNAQVYTGTAQWALANQYTDSVLAGPYSLESSVSAPFVTANENSPEIIFSIPYDQDDFQGFRIHMRTLHYQSNLTYDMPVGPWNGCAVVKDHFDTYSDNDLRKAAYFIYGPQLDSKGKAITESVTGTPLVIDPFIPALKMDASFTAAQIRTSGARIKKYEIAKGAKENLSNDFVIFRLADFYLMKSEIEIRLGNNGDEWVNEIRTRAGVSSYTNATLTDILAERGREMFAEGHRRQDLIRFGQFNKAWWEKPATTVDRNTFPIPKWATDANPNLLANPQ